MKNNSFLQWIREHWFGLGILLLVIVKHSFLAEQPFVARSSNPHDDTLFLSQAIYILNGEWLGPYNQLTLLRGPFYPLWIAFVYLLGIPLIHANDLLYLGACLVAVRALSPMTVGRSLLFAAFVFLYFAPHSYDYVSISHAFRMQIYPSLVLLVFAAALGLSIRLLRRTGSLFGWSLLLGVSFSCFWYTREEGIWALPALSVMAILIFGLLVSRISWPAALGALGYFVLCPVLIFAICSGSLMYMNLLYYGQAVTLDMKAPEFKRAYNALLRIKTDEPKHRVPVTRQTLRDLYDLSPKMRELQPYLDHTANNRPFEGELPAAIFIFSFRDAAAAAGYYDQGPTEVLAFFDGLADELDALCEQGEITCGKLLLSMVPLWRQQFTEKLPQAFFKQFYLMVRFPEFNVRPDRFFSFADQRFLYNTGRLTHSFPRVTKHAQWDTTFPDQVKEFKLEIARSIGNTHQILRTGLFFFALIPLAWFVFSDFRNKSLSLLTGFSLSLVIGIATLATALAIVEVTAFHMLFRPRHGGFPLVSLFIVCVFCELQRRIVRQRYQI